MIRHRTAIAAAAGVLLAFPAAASAYQFFSGLMGPGGSAVESSGFYTTYDSTITGSYVSPRSYRAGMAQLCCGGSSTQYVGSFYAQTLPIAYSNGGGVANSKGYCSRLNSGSGFSTVNCHIS